MRLSARVPIVLIVWSVAAALAPAPRAEVTLVEKKLSAAGDVRLRWEDDWHSIKPDGSRRDARDRLRLRLRAGLNWTPAGRWKLALRLRSGSHANPQSPHVTLFSLQGGEDGPWELVADRVLARYEGPRGWLVIGKQGQPFWSQSGQLFDDDLWMHGASGAWTRKRERLDHEIRLGAFAPPDSGAGNDLMSRGLIAGAQYVGTRKLASGKLVVAASLVALRDDGDAVNPNLDDTGYTTVTAAVRRQHSGKGAPIAWGIDLARQLESMSGEWNASQRTSAALHFDWGDIAEPGHWTLGYTYWRSERWAVDPWLAADDIVRWTGAGGSRAANARSHELRFGLSLRKNLDLAARLWITEGLEPETATATHLETGNRLRIDLNWRF